MGVISLDLQQTDAGYDVEKEIKRLDQEIDDEVAARVAADTSIWEEIETIEAASDVVDVVGTHAALEDYDTSKLQDNDIIKVLQDETRDDAITYYRWNEADSTFVYVGAEGPYYTASETDTLLAAKQDTLVAGANIQIAADGKTISATDTTYANFTGATASEDGTAGLVPAPVAGDEDKVLKGDGTWGTASPSYTAGTGIDITNDVISVDTTVVATQTDLSGKQDALTAGTNVQISNNVISATDTTYSNFVGTDGTTAGVAGLVPAPAVADDDKYLKSDGTWATVQSGGPTITDFFINDYLENIATGTQFAIYTDSALTTAIYDYDFYNAVMNGTVRLNYSVQGSGDMVYCVDFYMDNAGGYGENTEPYYVARCLNTYSPEIYEFSGFGGNQVFVLDGKMQPQAKLTAGSNITISGTTISARDTTYSAFGGATSSTAGASGLVPAPAAGDDTKFLAGDGTWQTVQGGSGDTTIFYSDLSQGDQIFADQAKTTSATAQDILDAFEAGKVIVVDDNGVQDTITTAEVHSQNGPVSFVFSVRDAQVYNITYTLLTDDHISGEESRNLQEQLTAGTNITISNDTISATDTTYTAGSNISISAQNVISATVPATNNISSTDWNTLWQ